MERKFFTVKELARLLEVSAPTLYRQVAAGAFDDALIRIGDRIKFRREVIQKKFGV